MKQQMQLAELSLKLEELENQKRDFVTDTRNVEFISEDNRSLIELNNGEVFEINNIAHSQICNDLKIPKKYYDRMQVSAPGLLMENVNHWLRDEPEKRLLRTICNGKKTARAWLSNKYRRIDNYDIAKTALPALAEIPGVRVESCALTDTNMHIKAVLPQIEAEIDVGDVVQAGIAIRNSEVGRGSVSVSLFIYRLACKNGMQIPDARSNTRHVGRRIETGDADVYEIYQDDTIEADDKAVLLKVRDMVKAAADELKFQEIVDKMRDAKNSEKIVHAPAAVEELGRRFLLPQDEQKGVLQHLIEGGDLSAYGMLNAVTRLSQDVDSYERATELEQIGGQILTLRRGEWHEVAAAA